MATYQMSRTDSGGQGHLSWILQDNCGVNVYVERRLHDMTEINGDGCMSYNVHYEYKMGIHDRNTRKNMGRKKSTWTYYTKPRESSYFNFKKGQHRRRHREADDLRRSMQGLEHT